MQAEKLGDGLNSRIVCAGELVHLFYQKEDAVFWRTSIRGVGWSQPIRVSESTLLGVMSYDVVAGGRDIHFAYTDMVRMHYKRLVDRQWSPDELLPSLDRAGGVYSPVIAVSQTKTRLFWRQGIKGLFSWAMPTGSQYAMAYSAREKSGWTEPVFVPGADNVEFMDVSPDDADNIYGAWVQHHTSWLARNTSLGRMDAKMTLELAFYSEDKKNWGRPTRLVDGYPNLIYKPRLAAGPDGRGHVMWIDRKKPDRFAWCHVKKNRCSKPKYVEAPGLFSCDITTDASAGAVLSVMDRTGLRVSMDAGTKGRAV